MYRNWIKWLILVGFSMEFSVSAQRSCPAGIRIEGTITDPTDAVIPGAQVQAAGGEKATSDASGHFILLCVPRRSVVITVQAAGFANGSVHVPHQSAGKTHIDIQLAVSAVQTDVQVSGDSEIDNGGATTTLNTKSVQGLADDPDDFLRELQLLASEAGGDPTQATIIVDGFQNASALPPKNSIASIRINPDLFSAKSTK